MDILQTLAQKVNRKPSEVLWLAANELGFFYPDLQANVWLARYVETRFIDLEVSDWALDKLFPRKEQLCVSLPKSRLNGKLCRP
jgi:hypothetical protein